MVKIIDSHAPAAGPRLTVALEVDPEAAAPVSPLSAVVTGGNAPPVRVPVAEWRSHPCTLRHDSSAEQLACHFGGASVSGTGDFAVISLCTTPAARLYPIYANAAAGLARLAAEGCGPGCTQRHVLLRVLPEDGAIVVDPAGDGDEANR